MIAAANHHHALPLPWVIVLMVIFGSLAFWLVTWAIPKLLTGKSPVWNREAWRNFSWKPKNTPKGPT